MALFDEIQDQASRLSKSEKGHLIHDLILSLDDREFSGDYEQEIAERLLQVSENKTFGVPAADVFKDIQDKHS